MADKELDAMMQRFLFDALQADWSDLVKSAPQVATSVKYQRWEQTMLANPFGWYRRKMQPLWKKCSGGSVSLVSFFRCTDGFQSYCTSNGYKVNQSTAGELYRVFFTNVSPKKDMLRPEYILTWGEDGYNLVEEENLLASIKNVYYENEEETPLLFGYMRMSNGNGSRVDTKRPEGYTNTSSGLKSLKTKIEPSLKAQ